jgi:hypothetical protein
VAWAIDVSNKLLPAGEVQINDQALVVEAGDFIRSAQELEKLVISVVDGVPVYLADVARVIDGPAEPTSYTWLGFGPASDLMPDYPGVYPAVAISIAKKKVPMRSGWPTRCWIILPNSRAISSHRKSISALSEITAGPPTKNQ